MWPIEETDSADKQKIFNRDECNIVLRVINELDMTTEKETSVAVITPYRHQVYELRNFIKTTQANSLTISVDTVDGFQGKESDIVIFSLTRTTGSRRFLADVRRLNVALSRARDRIFIIGNLKYAMVNELLRTISESCNIRTYYDGIRAV